jgi:hypothetical protein
VVRNGYLPERRVQTGIGAAPVRAPHWEHIRATNPIESIFSTVKLRTAKTRGCVSRAGMLAMVFKLTKTAEQK